MSAPQSWKQEIRDTPKKKHTGLNPEWSFLRKSGHEPELKEVKPFASDMCNKDKRISKRKVFGSVCTKSITITTSLFTEWVIKQSVIFQNPHSTIVIHKMLFRILDLTFLKTHQKVREA